MSINFVGRLSQKWVQVVRRDFFIYGKGNPIFQRCHVNVYFPIGYSLKKMWYERVRSPVLSKREMKLYVQLLFKFNYLFPVQFITSFHQFSCSGSNNLFWVPVIINGVILIFNYQFSKEWIKIFAFASENARISSAWRRGLMVVTKGSKALNSCMFQ